MTARARDPRRDKSKVLHDVAEILGGRPESGDDGQVWSVRLPRRLGRGELYFYDGPISGVGVDIKGGSALYMVIGGPGPAWDRATERLDIEEPDVYFDPSISSEEAVRTWVVGNGRERIRDLRLRPEDRVHVALNVVTAILAGRPAPLDIAVFVEAVAALARTLPPSVKERRPTVPTAFADLQALAKRFAVTDDADRADKLQSATNRALRQLVEAVKPRLGAIDQALHAADEPLTDELIDLHSLAQAALEAESELALRDSAHPTKG